MTASRPTLSSAARRPGRRLGAESGISLIEVMVAVVVITVGVLALGAVIPTGIHKVTDSETDTRASALASDRCEQLLVTPFDDGDLDAGTHQDSSNPHDNLYNVSWIVEDDQPAPDCKRITVNVVRVTGGRNLSKLVIVVPKSNG